MTMTSTFKAGYVGLIGQPNAGKSTLLNALIGEKVAIVTPKPQTTRQRVVGLLNTPKAQICFVDAPGVIRAKKGLNRFLEKEYSDVIEQSDVLVAVLNLDEEKFEALEQVLKLVASARRPWLAVVTKDDLPMRHRMPILRHLVESYGVPLIEISAEQRPEELADGLVAALVEKLPPSPGPLFDPELYTTSNVRELVSEIVREKCFLNLHQEIPFNLAVRMRSFVENEGPSVKIHAEIVVGKENHRPMVLGVKGERIKTIGTEARKDIEKLVGRSVFLDLHVALKKNWVGNESMMQELGYVVKQH